MLQYLLFLILGLVGIATIIIVVFLLGLMVPGNWADLCDASTENYEDEILGMFSDGLSVVRNMLLIIGGIIAAIYLGSYIYNLIT